MNEPEQSREAIEGRRIGVRCHQRITSESVHGLPLRVAGACGTKKTYVVSQPFSEWSLGRRPTPASSCARRYNRDMTAAKSEIASLARELRAFRDGDWAKEALREEAAVKDAQVKDEGGGTASLLL